MNIKTIRFVTPLLVLAVALLMLVGSASANTTPPEFCGQGGASVDGLGLAKKVKCDFTSFWDWTIQKVASASSLTLSLDQKHTVNYTVTAKAVSSGSFHVYGPIYVKNLTATAITLVSVEDVLGETSCPVAFPYTLEPGVQLECWYDGVVGSQPSQNIVKVTRDSGLVSYLYVPLSWDQTATTVTDECVNVTDTFAGPLGTVCAGAQTSFEFKYSREVGGYAVCGDYRVDNTASFVTNDNGNTGSADANVQIKVPCAAGCTLTPGYWKTHSKYGPAPFDSLWLQKAGGDAMFLGTNVSYYNVLWTNSSGGNAFYILAHAYIAAELNMLDGASAPAAVVTAFNQATAMLTTYQAALSIPKGADRTLAISLASILDNYNNGLTGPGHCSE